MQKILVRFLEAAAVAKDVVDVNIAAGIALEELEKRNPRLVADEAEAAT